MSSASNQTTLTDSILCGDARKVLKDMPDDLVDTTITSPPYFQQRDYGNELQVGNEATVDEYVQRLVEIFSELLRVTKPTGSLWVVIGDKYIDGELQGVPWTLALALKSIGWRLRSDVIWQKPNAMPSAAKTRPTIDHEYVFFFSKSKPYYYDADAIREPHVTFSENSKMKGGRKHFGKRNSTPEKGKNGGKVNLHDGRWDQAFHPKGRNKRTVWSISLSKFRKAHFAVFPEQLVETCMLATCPETGLVLDPFSGSGTTSAVAKRLNRHWLGIDCSPEYCEMARDRISAVEPHAVLLRRAADGNLP